MDMDMFIILIVVMLSQVYACFKTYQILHSKYVPVSCSIFYNVVCQLFFNELFLKNTKKQTMKRSKQNQKDG